MCVVCIERAKGTITVKEAISALRELIVIELEGPEGLQGVQDHLLETRNKLIQEDKNEKQV